MTKAAALHEFFNSLMDAYPASNVPEDVAFPYLTYELVTNTFTSTPSSMTVQMWFRTDSESVPNAKAEQLSALIGHGGKRIPCDGGFIWLTRGTPFSQAMHAEDDVKVKIRYININVQYMTLN